MCHPNVGINKALLLLHMWLLVFPWGLLSDPNRDHLGLSQLVAESLQEERWLAEKELPLSAPDWTVRTCRSALLLRSLLMSSDSILFSHPSLTPALLLLSTTLMKFIETHRHDR